MTLREWLTDQDMTPTAFSREMGVAHSTVLRWLDGSMPPSSAALQRVYEVTDGRVTANDMLGQCTAAV